MSEYVALAYFRCWLTTQASLEAMKVTSMHFKKLKLRSGAILILSRIMLV